MRTSRFETLLFLINWPAGRTCLPGAIHRDYRAPVLTEHDRGATEHRLGRAYLGKVDSSLQGGNMFNMHASGSASEEQ